MTDPTKQPGILVEGIFLKQSSYERAPQLNNEFENSFEFTLGILKETECTVILKTIFTRKSKKDN